MIIKFKVEGRVKEYDFKHVNLTPDHNMDDNSLALLWKIDEALVNSKNEGKFQEQLNDIYVRLEEKGLKPYTSGGNNPKQKELTEKWIRAFFKKKDTSAIEQELKSFETKAFSEYLDTTDSTTGGYLVPELLAGEVFRVIEENGYARRDMRYMPFAGPGNTRQLPVEATAISVDWIDEMGKKPLSTPTFDQVAQTLKKVGCISVFTEELLEDSAINLLDYAARRIGEAIAEKVDSDFFAGVGVDWTGIINSAGITPVQMAAGETLKDITPSHLLDMIFAVAKKYRAGAKFYISSDVMLYILKFRVDAGGAPGDSGGSYLVGNPLQGQPATLWGYPVVITDVLPGEADADEADVPFCFFANLSKTAVYGDKNSNLRIRILDQASLTNEEGDTINLAQYDAMAVRVISRCGYCLTLPEGVAVLSTGESS
jgi:HK97 family phage major capsid protein